MRVIDRILIRVAILLACPIAVAMGDAYVPARDDDVLETLPRSLLENRKETTQLRRSLNQDPNNADLASRLANHYLRMGNAEGDPRFYGYARSAIQPWWDTPLPPPTILQLRAKLKEKDHLYDQALDDLKVLLNAEPRDVQAWIEVANIHRVQGDYAVASQACDDLARIAGPVPVTMGRASLLAVTGHAEEAYQSLDRILPLVKTDWPTALQWVITMQAQIAIALGRNEEAEAYLLDGLGNDPNDNYLRRAYGDFLLDQNRSKQALAVVREHTGDEGLLLIATIAARRSGDHELASGWKLELERRFDEIRLRGGQPHGRFEARYWLEVLGDGERALEIALANWQRQKEAADTRILLESAAAAGDRRAAQPALDFLTRHHTENVTLNRLVQRLNQK